MLSCNVTESAECIHFIGPLYILIIFHPFAFRTKMMLRAIPFEMLRLAECVTPWVAWLRYGKPIRAYMGICEPAFRISNAPSVCDLALFNLFTSSVFNVVNTDDIIQVIFQDGGHKQKDRCFCCFLLLASILKCEFQ